MVDINGRYVPVLICVLGAIAFLLSILGFMAAVRRNASSPRGLAARCYLSIFAGFISLSAPAAVLWGWLLWSKVLG
jgi:hypothetical protein